MKAAERAVQLQPDEASCRAVFARVLTRVAERHSAAGELKQALEVYQRAVALEPHLANRHAALAHLALEANDLVTAVEAAERAVQLQPDEVSCRAVLARVLTRVAERHSAAGELKQALEAYRRAVALEPHLASRHAALARLALKVNGLATAMEAAERALQLEPDEASNRALLASVLTNVAKEHSAAGEWKQALEAYRRAVALQPHLASRHAALARLALKVNGLVTAMEAAERGPQLETDEASYRALSLSTRFTEAHSAAGGWGQSQDAYQRAMAHEPDRAAPLPNDLATAVEAAERAVQLQPDNQSFWSCLARVTEAVGDIPRTREAWKHAIELGKSSPGWHISLARACFLLNDFEAAAKAIEPITQRADSKPEWLTLFQLIKNRLGVFDADKDARLAAEWHRVQLDLADLSGDRGIIERQRAYAPFFLHFGRDIKIENGCRFNHPSKIVLSDGCILGEQNHIDGEGGVWIGRRARIGSNCAIASSKSAIDSPDNKFGKQCCLERVRIGDDVVISSDTTIPPGAEVGAGSFVSKGTVVEGRPYPEGSRLDGEPARVLASPTSSNVEYAPEIAVIVPDEGHWRDAARHLVTSLGLPQIEIVTEKEDWPETITVGLAFGPPDFEPRPQGRPLWRLTHRLPHDGSRGPLSSYPLSINIPTVIARADLSSPLAAEAALFWCLVRLTKTSRRLTSFEIAEWLLSLYLMNVQDGRQDCLAERVFETLTDWAEPPFVDIIRQIAAESDRPMRERLAIGLARIAEAAKDIKSLAVPLEAINAGRLSTSTIESLRKRLEMPLPTIELLAIRCAVAIASDACLEKTTEERLTAPRLWQANVPFPRTAISGTGLVYSPLVAAWHLMRSKRSSLPDHVASPKQIERRLVSSECGNFAGFDMQNRLVAAGLLTDWLALHSAPIPSGRQIVLQEEQYQYVLHHLEDAWIGVFRAIQAESDRPLVRLRPWPAPYRAAIALRLDVDRPVAATKINVITDIQQQYLSGPAGSWYYFAQDDARSENEDLLSRNWQEIGIHALNTSDAVVGLGVTHHSAPNSSYWEGDKTLTSLDALDASYGEFLSAQVGLPRPAWINAEDGLHGKFGRMWITPIHFPLEGSTSDTSLAYFDKLLDKFRDLIRVGGLAIVGTHPDVNQEILAELFRRENLRYLWATTIDRAVDRCRLVFGEHTIRIARTKDTASIAVISSRHVTDLSISIYWPGRSEPQQITAQLRAGQPHVIAHDGLIQKGKQPHSQG